MSAGGHTDFACGPLEIAVTSDSDIMRRKVRDTLELFNVPWSEPRTRWSIDISSSEETAHPGPGAYLECARMNVDPSGITGRDLSATCPSGIAATSSRDARKWSITVPVPHDDPWKLTDMESVLSLVLTEGWRAAGWIPVHAATILRDDRCAIVCAASGGGKTTLTAALIRRGWQTLGDDKLLLRIGSDGRPELRALVHTFNLHPQTRTWFSEVGDLEKLPSYSEWTEKRKVSPESIWPGSTANSASPDSLLLIERTSEFSRASVSAMSAEKVLSTLLRQTVIPSRRAEARAALSTISATARQLSGLIVRIGDDAYREPDCLDSLEAVLLSLDNRLQAFSH